MTGSDSALCAERQRLAQAARREKNWKRWGPYLSERQWGTVREDYSDDGNVWAHFPHDHARSRVYRWGEDGLLGITDRECRVCFALALHNGRDPILKERLFGLGGPEGNHGEDVKELYYYVDATPSYAYFAALYKYPQAAFPYQRLVEENRRRSRLEREYEIEDTGVFDEGRYFDVLVEYAKAGPDDILVRISCHNLAEEAAQLHVLPTLWLPNTWAWGRKGEGYWSKGSIFEASPGRLVAEQPGLERFQLSVDASRGDLPRLVFTDNETNTERLWGTPNASPYVKDAFHRLVVEGDESAVNPAKVGTKAAAWYRASIAGGQTERFRLRLCAEEQASAQPFGADFDELFRRRRAEADEFYSSYRNPQLTREERRIARRADAGLLWSRQYYHFVVEHWLEGDPTEPAPPPGHRSVRNRGWRHLWARDVLTMPDKWEYPWFAAWDLAFHAVATVRVDPDFAKEQVLLLCREWYMHPSGQLPAYEFAFNDANPPLLAWAAWRVYQLARDQGYGEDRVFLATAFQKCLVNFTWWVNQKDADGNNLFAGGFLGLDNIGVFDRSKPLGGIGKLEQADASAWMAFYSSTMLAIALELAQEDAASEHSALKFFEHFLAIAHSMNEIGGDGLWDDEDGFYYDRAHLDGHSLFLRIRSMVGIIPLFAAEALPAETLEKVPLFERRLAWFLENRPNVAGTMACMHADAANESRLLSIPSRDRLVRVLGYVLDEKEFLSPFGVRSLSKYHAEHPYRFSVDGSHQEIAYTPGESDTGLFGGNSNWRGPVWLPLNYLLIEALKRHHHFYGDGLRVECPVGSGRQLNLLEVAEELERRIARLFLRDKSGGRPCLNGSKLYRDGDGASDLLLFHEYFHADTGEGLGASHQTGWTALVANILERVAASRERS